MKEPQYRRSRERDPRKGRDEPKHPRRAREGSRHSVFKLPSFHGKNDADIYLEWEREIEHAFEYQHYSEDNKMRIATSSFHDYALSWWDQFVISRRHCGDKPVETWTELKAIMRRRHAPKSIQNETQHRSEPRRDSQDIMCKSRAKPAPSLVQTKAKMSSVLDKHVSDFSITSMMHLSLSKSVKTGPTKEPTSKGEEMSQEQTEVITPAILLKDIQPEHHFSSDMSKAEQGKASSQEQHIVVDPGAIHVPKTLEPKENTEAKPCDIKHKAGKEIVVVDTIIPRYVFLVTPEAKLLEIEHIKKQYDSNDNLNYVFPSCEEFEHKNIFRHKTGKTTMNPVFIDVDRLSKVTINKMFDMIYILIYDKNIDDHAKHSNFVLDNLSGNLLARNEHTSCTYDPLLRDFAVRIQVIQEGELDCHSPKTRLYHVWLKENVAQADLEPVKYLIKKHHADKKQCRMIFEPGGSLWIEEKRGRLPAPTEINAYKISLQGEYNLSLMFGFSNLISFLADCSDLRSNPSQEGGDDMIMTSLKKQLEPELVAELVAEWKQLEAEGKQPERKKTHLDRLLTDRMIDQDVSTPFEVEFEAEEHAAEKPLIIPKCSTIQKQETTSTPTQDG